MLTLALAITISRRHVLPITVNVILKYLFCDELLVNAVVPSSPHKEVSLPQSQIVLHAVVTLCTLLLLRMRTYYCHWVILICGLGFIRFLFLFLVLHEEELLPLSGILFAEVFLPHLALIHLPPILLYSLNKFGNDSDGIK